MKFKGKLQRPNQIQRFSIRKFSVGIASVVIGSFFMGTIAPISVQAQESISSQYVASAPTLSSITTSYQYVALQELTPAQQQAILSGTPSDIAQADQVYYFVYRPIESKQVLPATGEAAPLFGAMAGALTLIVAVGLIRDRKKTIMTLMVVSSLGQILSTSATLALESRLLNRYNQVFYSQQGDQLPDPRIHIEGYEYVGYFAQATLRQTNNTLPQSSESSSQVQSNEEVSSEEPSSQVASESSSSSPANAVVTSSVASSESSVSTSDLSSNDAESSSEAQLSSESEASLSQSSEVTVSESSSQSSESSQPVESTQSSDQPVSSEPAESESSQAVISQPAESSSQVESTPQLSSEASSQNQTPNPAESSSEAPSPTPAPTPQPEPPKPLNYAAWQANLEQAQAGWQVLTNDDLSGKTPKSVKAYNDALAILKQDYQALVEAMTSLQASGAVSQSEIDQLTSKMTGIIARQVALPDTLVKRADQTPLITQSDNLANLVKTLNATDLSQKTPASVQALKEQIKFAQAALQNGGSVLKDGDATEADITAMAQNLANQLKSLQDAQAALQDRADLSALKEALNQLAKPINTDGKTPKSVKQFEAAKAAYAERLAELIAQANAVQEDPNASQEQVDTVVAKVQAFQREVNQAQELLVDQTDKKVLTQSKADLDQLLASEPDLSNKTPKSVAAYRQAKEVAQRLTQEAAQLLANLDASPMEVLELNEQLNQAQEKLRTAETAIMAVADKESLRQAKQGLAKKPDTTGKTPKSVAAYQAQVQALARELAQVNDQAQAVLDDANASPAEVEAALAQVQAQQEKLDQAAKLLKDQANKTALEQAIRALETDLAQEVEGSNKTPFSLALFRQKQEEAREALKQANRIVQDLDASPDEVATAEERVNQSKAALKHAKENLRDQAGKATLHKLLEEMVKPVSTEGKTPKSIQEYQTEYGRHRAEIDAALAKGAQVAEDKNATEDAVQEAISALEQALERKSNSQLLLVNQVDKTALRAARQELQDLLSQKPDLNDKTPASIRDYQEVLEEAETELDLLSSLIEDPNTAEDEMNDALAQSQTTMASLESAIAALTPKADKVALEQALSQINQPIDLVGKTPNSVTAFEEAKQANQASRDQAIQKAQDVILDENATPEAVSQALTELKAAQAKLDQARAKLVNQSDKSALKQARAALDTILQAQADLTNKTPQSVGAYERARQAAQAQVQDAQAIIADANATPNAVAEAVNKIKEAQANLKAAQEGLTNQADKAKLIQALATLKQPISTEGKTPKSIQAFNQAQNDQLAQVEAAKNEAERIIANQDASPEQVSQALQAIQEAQSQINQAKALLVNQADKSALEQAKQNLDTAIQATPNLTNKTPQSVQAYEQAKANAQAAVQAGQAVIADLNASPESVEAAKTRITQAQAALKTAQDNLRDKANKAGLQSALTALNAPISTAGKSPRSIDAFRVQETGYQADLNSAKQAAQAVLADENATASQVAQALEQVQAIQARVNAAKALLVEQADKSALTSERTKLQNEVDQAPDLANKTPQSIAAYEAAKAQADAALAKALSVQNDLNATPAQVQEAIKQLQASHTVLTAAKSGLQTKADKQALIAALNKLNAPIATNGKTPNSIRAFEQAQATDNATTDQAKAKAQAVIADENATEAQVAQALQAVRDAQTKVDVAKALLVNQADKSALEQAKQNLDTAIQATPNLANKTPQSVQAYEQAKSGAQAAVQAGQAVIADLNASPEAVEAAKARITQAQAALKAAQDNLQDKANKAGLQSALNALNAPISTAGKTPNSIRAFEQAQAADKATTDQAKAKAQAVIADENATEAQVAQALQAVREAQTKVDIAKAFLVNQADKSALEQAKQNLDTALQTTPSLANKTPQSVQVYEQAKADAQAAVQAGQAIIADLNASPEAVEAAKARISQAQADLEAAKNNLRDKADKSSLVQALATLNQTVSTTNKTPNSIQAYQARLKAQDGVISPAKSKAAQVIADENASREQVEDALRAVQAAQTQVNQAAGLLVNQADKHLLSEAINNSQAELNQAPTLADKTPKSVSAYEQAKVTAQAALGAAKDVQSDPNATQAQVQDAINRLASTKKALEKAKSALQVKGDKAGLRAAYEALNSPISTVGKTPRSIDAFRTQESGYQSELDAAKQAAQSVLADENATASQVAQALEQVQAIQAKVNAAKTLLVDQADKSALTSERTKLQNEVDQAPDLANKTPQSIATYESAKAQADAALAKALSVQNDLNATPAQVQEAVNQLKASHTALTSAKAGLQTKADKQALITALNKLNEPIATDGKTPASITAYRNSLTANQSTINQAKAQAQAMIANENASQVQVNEALQAIKSAQVKIDEAKNKLVDQANKQALQASIAEAGPLVENHYTPASWQALQTQLSAAKQVNQDPNASQSAVDSAKQALDQAIAQLVMHTPRFTSQEVVLPTDELSRSVTVNYTLFDPANKYQSAQVKVYQGDQLVQTVAINNNQAVINSLNYEVPYRLVTELTYADKSGVSKTDPQLSEERVELKLKKFELKQIKEEGLYQVEGQELKRVSALASVPQDLSGYLVKVSSDRYKDVVLKVAAIEATTYNGEDYYQVTATAPELVQNNGGTTDYHQTHQFLVRKAAPAVNNVYHSFGELLTAMKANLSGTFILGSNVSAADVVLAKGQEAYLMDTFRGKLLGRGADGQAHAIFDLKAPLFKETNQATISNLDLKRVDIRDRDNVGSLAVVANQTTITDVTASGRLSGSQSIGGLVATVLGGSQLSQVGFKGSIESMAFNGANSTIGGIVANLEKGSITQATADINMHLSSGNENSRYGGLVGAVGSGSSLTKAVVKGNIWNSGSGVLRRWGSSTGGAVGSTWSNSRIDQVISETKVDNGRIFFGHRNAEQQESTRRSFSNIAVVQDVASGIEQEFLKSIETISPQEAANRQQAMGITVSFDDSSDAVTTLSKESLMTDYTAMPNYKADKAQAYANKEQIIKYGNLATGKLASQVLVSVTPMMGSNYVTDYSQPMDRIMLHYADKSVQYLGLAAKSNFKQTGIVEYQLEDSGLIYTPNQIQQASIESLAQDLAAQLSATDLYSDKMFELLGIKTKNYVNDKVKQTRKDALQKTLGRVPTDEELQADLDAVNQAERIKDVKRLYLEDTLARLKPNLTDAVKKVLKQSLNLAIDGGHSGLEAQLKQQVLDNKEALLLGLLYMHRHYEIKFGEANIGEIATYQADFFGKSENVLDKLIYLGSRGINALHTKNNFRAYAPFISPNQAVGNLLDYLDYFRETLTDLDENAWFRQATQQNLVLEERASREAGLANKEYRIYPRLKARSVQNYILPLLNLKDSTLFAISTVNGFTWGSLDRRSYDRQRLEELVNLMANRQQTHLDTWYRMALPAVKDRIANNPGNQTWDGYKDATGQWFGEFGESNAKGNAPKKPSMGIREFFGPIGRYFGANGSAAYADTISNIYFIHTDMLNDYNGASIWTHELVHLQDRSINLGGYGWRPDERFEQYPQGLLQAPENPSTINHMGINTIFDYSNEKLRYYNESPDRFQTAADVHEYVHGVFDVLYTLDYAEGLDVLARGKDFWKKMYNQVTNEADGVHANNLIKELTDQEWENINLTSINDLVEHQLVVKRGYGANAKYNRDNYVTINMYAPNYATGENTTGSPGGLMFKRMAWEMMAYKGYEDGFVPYASDKLQKEAKAAGNAELSDTYVIKSVSGGEFQNMTVFKQAMFKERIDKLNQSLIPITVNGTQVRTFADIQQLIHQAMEADIKTNLLTRGDNNVHKVKKEIYRQYLLATNDFRTSIFQGQ